MFKQKNKIFILVNLTLIGVLFSGSILFFFNHELKKIVQSDNIIPIFIQNRIISGHIDQKIKHESQLPYKNYRIKIEQSFRIFGNIHFFKEVDKYLQRSLNISNLKIYDNSFRLIFSELKDKEVFNKELRFSTGKIFPGDFSKLGEYEIYRTMDGMYYLGFKYNYDKNQKSIQKLDILSDSMYWVFNKNTNFLQFTNDQNIFDKMISPDDKLNFLKSNMTTLEIFQTQEFNIFYKTDKISNEVFVILIIQFFFILSLFIGISYFSFQTIKEKIIKSEMENVIQKSSEKINLLKFLEKIEKKLSREIINNAK